MEAYDHLQASYHYSSVTQQYAAAERELQLSIAHDPDLAYPRIEYAYLLLSNGDLQRAIAEGRKAVELEPDYPDAHSMLGMFYYNAGDGELARASSEKALELEPSNFTAHVTLGYLDAWQERADSAEAHFKKALRLIPIL